MNHQQQDKRTVLFVGAFEQATNSGSTGGQMFACKSLLSSRLSDRINWVLVDTTAELPEKPLPIRALRAAKRVALFSYHLFTKKIDTTLIFTAHGASFLEKGTMCLLSRIRGRKTIIAPRSGLITNDMASSLRRRFMKLVFSKASVVICQSPHWKNLFESLEPNGNYVVVHNWIDHTRYEMAANTTGNADTQSNYHEPSKRPNHLTATKDRTSEVPGQPIRLFFLGWVTRDKGIFELVDAILDVAKHHHIELHIGGHGDAFDEVANIVRDHQAESTIIMHGWIGPETKLQQLHQADIYVQPTHFEGFSNALLEAMCAAKPIVCSDIPALTSVVAHNVHCVHFEVGSSRSLSAALMTLINDPALQERISTNAYQLAKEQFSIEYGVKQFDELL